MPFKYITNENGHYVCQICSTVKEKMNTMHYHLKNHDGNYSFECNKCTYKCMQKKSLENHILARHNSCDEKTKQFKCVFPECSFESFTKGNCKIHCSRKHFKEETDKIRNDNNSCSNCNKSFKSNEAFDYHALNCIAVSQDKKKLLDTILEFSTS